MVNDETPSENLRNRTGSSHSILVGRLKPTGGKKGNHDIPERKGPIEPTVFPSLPVFPYWDNSVCPANEKV
jgi:hypothetical protein